MAKIGTSLPEVAILMTIPGIALKSTLCIIAELGDIRRSHSANAINAYIGVDLTWIIHRISKKQRNPMIHTGLRCFGVSPIGCAYMLRLSR